MYVAGASTVGSVSVNPVRTLLTALALVVSAVFLAACTIVNQERPQGDLGEGGATTLAKEFTQQFTRAVTGKAATITVGDAPTGAKMRVGNLGISFEATELADPRWDPDSSNLDELLTSLGSPALRFGGNRLDRSVFWTSSGEATPSGDVTVTPDDFRRLRKMLDATGSSVTIGIPLGDFDPARGADMADSAITILGEHLVGLSIGNEPNGYTVASGDLRVRDDSWDTAAYEKQLVAYVDAIVDEHPDAPIIGPSAYDTQWMDAFTEAMAGAGHAGNIAAISQHWYALFDCDATAVPGRGPEAENFTTPTVRDAASTVLGMGLGRAKQAGVPLWVEETGPTSCAGTNEASTSFGSALWTADYVLDAATMGVVRVGMHSSLDDCESGPPMSTVCAGGAGSGAGGGVGADGFTVRDNFRAMQVVSPTVGGDFVPAELEGGGNMRVYATVEGDSLVTVIINDNDASSTGGNPVTLKVPAGFTPVSASQLAGQSNTTTTPGTFLPQLPLPAGLPFTSPTPTGAGSTDSAGNGAGSLAGAVTGTSLSNSTPGGTPVGTPDTDAVLQLDVAASSVTAIVWNKTN